MIEPVSAAASTVGLVLEFVSLLVFEGVCATSDSTCDITARPNPRRCIAGEMYKFAIQSRVGMG
jgi:hypothetical protein